MARPKVGSTFALATDLGFVVVIVTHDVPKVGTLVWISQAVFEEEPSIDEVRKLDGWRWPILFPLSAAIRRRVVTPIGVVPIPPELEKFPVLRTRDGSGGWTLVKITNGIAQPLGPATDPSVPRYNVVNDTRLKEMVVAGWRPEEEW